MKLQDQTLFPLTHAIRLLPKARRPPKAPAIVAMETNMARREAFCPEIPICEIIIVPGKNPDSRRPRR